MEGYSVTEAASVLGVPTERVWELLARGILSGAPDGETGMRVFLQPRPAAPPNPLDHARPEFAAGGQRVEPAGELSPFRELLTEFRNLTERYGQALLALGEARGEVATLRSRVDLLEARMDLRLPAPGPMAPAAWPDRRPEAMEAPVRAGGSAPQPAAGEEDSEEEARPRRRRQRATENFAEALARAEDPTAPDLPDPARPSTERAAVRAAQAAAAPEPAPEAAMPRELPAAAPIDLAAEPVDTAPAPQPQPQPEPEPEPEPEVEPQPIAVESAVEPPHEAEVSLDPDADLPAVSAQPPPVAAEPSAGAPVAEATRPPVEGAEAATRIDDRPPIDWDPERYTVEVAEPDWFEAEADDRAPASPAVPRENVTPAPPAWAEPEMSEAAADEALAEEPDVAAAGSVATEPAGSERAGAEEMEVVGAPPRFPTLRGQPAGLPGGSELHEALSALEALARDASPRPAPPTAAEPRWPRALEPGRSPVPAPPPPSAPSRLEPTPATTPATRAYRRLRRIFPG